MPSHTNTPSLEKKCILMKSIFPEAFMTYSEIEEKIRKVPEGYLNVIDAFIDSLILQCQTIEAQTETIQKRKLGLLKGKASVKFADDFSITPEEMLGM